MMGPHSLRLHLPHNRRQSVFQKVRHLPLSDLQPASSPFGEVEMHRQQALQAPALAAGGGHHARGQIGQEQADQRGRRGKGGRRPQLLLQPPLPPPAKGKGACKKCAQEIFLKLISSQEQGGCKLERTRWKCRRGEKLLPGTS